MSTPLDGYSDDDSDLDAASLRVLFRDTTPVGVAPAPAAGIPYSPAFVTVLGIVRAAAAADEASPRALLATAAALVRHNAADYSVWEYRRRVVRRLAQRAADDAAAAAAAAAAGGGGGSSTTSDDGGPDAAAAAAAAAVYSEELKFTFRVGLSAEKNYQVWHHRRLIAAKASTAAVEADYAAAFHAADSKNYHAWAHRQWAAAHWAVDPAGEVAYAAALLSDDVRNNSAWAHRHFALVRLPGLAADAAAAAATALTPGGSATTTGGKEEGGEEGEEGATAAAAVPSPRAAAPTAADEAERLAAACPAELAVATDALRQVKDNRSAWAYLLWWARLADAPTRVAVVADVAALVAEAPAARLPPVMLGRLRSLE